MISEKMCFYTLENPSGTRLTLTDAGAAVTSLTYRGVDVVLGWGDPGIYADNPSFFGATVGRCANRTAGAAFSLDGRTWILGRNDGLNNLHSGPDGWHARRWETADVGDDFVTFYLDSPDGDQGFPGRVRIWAMYTLTAADRVHIRFKAVPESDTILNVTNHAYFNLNGHGSGSVEGHILQLNADSYTPCGEGLIPTGEIADVTGTPFDFRAAHPIGRDLHGAHPQLTAAGGFDHNLCLSGSGLRTAGTLRGDKSGIVLELITDRPGVQFYSGNSLRGEAGKGGARYSRHGALCLETQCWPDAIHHERFPSPVVSAGEEWTTETVWAFRTDGA